MRSLLAAFLIGIQIALPAQTWVDSLDNFAREVHLPARNYVWNWQNASLLHAMEIQYELMPEQQDGYLEYVRRAMEDNFFWANGLLPNYIASGNGMAFMYEITGEERYLESANSVFDDYLNIARTSNGGVTHLPWTKELWDDTIYMIGVFLLAMYEATGNETYLDELIEQFRAHHEKLSDPESGLWVHGWDEDGIYTFDFCSQADWADEETGRSEEFWGRGNGWVVVTLSELLNTMPETHPEREFIAGSLLEMISSLPEWQDEATGHWYQLPARPGEAGNFIESSCTAMFGYGLLTALKLGLVEGEEYENAVKRAYHGLRDNSTFAIDPENAYLNTRNVCAETCIGDKDYYFGRNIANGRSYALAMSIIFGRSYEAYINDITTPVTEWTNSLRSVRIFPTLLGQNDVLNIEIDSDKHQWVSLQVMDVSGRTLYHATEELVRGVNHYALSTTRFCTGVSFVMVREYDGPQLKTIPIVVR